MIEFTISASGWQRQIFNDHISEDSLTDAMMNICHSLVEAGEVKALSDQELLDDLEKLDKLRGQIPEAFDGLDAVLHIIRDLDQLSSGPWKRAKALTAANSKDVIDLTDD